MCLATSTFCTIAGEAGSNMRPSELRLRRCLDARTRRWCMYEFFCSALDRPWLLACELREWLAHAGLPADLCLTRAEWVAVRAALGRPRRLSLAFLHEVRWWRCCLQLVPKCQSACDCALLERNLMSRITEPRRPACHDGSRLWGSHARLQRLQTSCQSLSWSADGLAAVNL